MIKGQIIGGLKSHLFTCWNFIKNLTYRFQYMLHTYALIVPHDEHM